LQCADIGAGETLTKVRQFTKRAGALPKSYRVAGTGFLRAKLPREDTLAVVHPHGYQR
jgi:hypothetical protein